MLSTKEISEMLRVSEETVRRWIRNGELEATQDGKSYQIDKDWLEEFIQKKSVIPGTSLAKMQSLIEGIIGNPKTKDAAADFFSKSITKFMQGGDMFSDLKPEPEYKAEPKAEPKPEPEFKAEPKPQLKPEPTLEKEDIEGQIESLNRLKKKLELEYQIKLLDLEGEIAVYERKLRNANK